MHRLVNRLGHAAGDEVLTQVARRVEGQLRPHDTLGRIGGEEFLIIAPGADGPNAGLLAERVRAAVASRTVAVGDERVDVTISLGWTLVDPLEPDALDRALARADQALYRSKAEGRNRVSDAS